VVHDIWLGGIPDNLSAVGRNPPVSLNEAERFAGAHIRCWARNCAVRECYLQEVGPRYRAHERFDARLSCGLSGGNIPWLARLLSVAVAYAESDLDPQHACGNVISRWSGSEI